MRNFILGVLALLAWPIASPGQAPTCGTELWIEGGNSLNGHNFVNLVVDRGAFPIQSIDSQGHVVAGIPDLVFAAVDAGAERWNDTCDAIHRDQPKMIVSETPLPFDGVRNVLVTYQPQAFSEFPCGLEQVCLPIATTSHSWNGEEGIATITLFGLHGNTADPLKNTFTVAEGKYQRVFEHELGHLLGLDHDTCHYSVMMGAANDLLQIPMALIKQDQCDKLDEMFEAADPLEPIGNSCILGRYCLNGRPWPLYITICRWETSTAQVSSYAGNQFIGMATTSYNESYCTQQAVRFLADWEVVSSPMLIVMEPADGAVVSGPIQVSGWAWERGFGLGEVKVFVDGQIAPMVGFQYRLPSSLSCRPDLDPEFCDPNSRFAGLLDTSSLTPGRHQLQVVATDMSEHARPVLRSLEIVVHAPNQAPLAQDDHVYAAVVNDVPLPRAVDVLANDDDPESGALKVRGLLTQPTQGTATLDSSGWIVYQPFPSSSGTDHFDYEIEDVFGARSTATVYVEILHGLFIP